MTVAIQLRSPRAARTADRRAVLHAAALAAGLAASGLALPAGAAAQAPEPAEVAVGAAARQDLTVTVYNQDLAQVSERRRVSLAAGANRLALVDVPDRLEPASVLLRGAGLSVTEQSFAFDLVTPQRLLEAAVGGPVKLIRTNPETGEDRVFDARLLGISQGPVVEVEGRVETAPPGRIALDSLPPGLRARPTLLAVIDSAAAATRSLSLDYLTGGLSWRADYAAEVDPEAGTLDLTGYVTLTNDSGADFANAHLRLVAGEVARAPGGVVPAQPRLAMEATAMAAPAMPAPAQAVSDRYVYDVPRPVDLRDRETKQIVLLAARGVTAAREYRFTGLVGGQPGPEKSGPVNAEIRLTLENTEAAGLGRPLPGGVVRVYEATGAGTGGGDAGGGALFIGEDRLRHSAVGEKIELTLGRAFDVTGEAHLTAFDRLSNRSYELAREAVVRNAKDTPVAVRLVADMPRGWRILQESAAHESESANRIVWPLTVPAGGEATLSYRLRVDQ